MLVNNNDDHDYQKHNDDYVFNNNIHNTNKRWEQYQDLSELGRSLMDLLYSGSDNYLKAIGYNSVKNDIEKHIIAYDQNLDHEGALRSIANNLGYELPLLRKRDDTIQELLYYYLVDYVKSNKNK